MAYDDLQRGPSQLMADFIEHTRDACWDLQFYAEWRLNHGLESEPVIAAFVNVLVAFRQLLRAGVKPDGELVAQPEPLMGRRADDLVAALRDDVDGWRGCCCGSWVSPSACW